MSDHTPGPWSIGEPGNGTPGYVYCNNDLGSAVAIVYGPALGYSVFSRAEEKANARLIAAAPELLAHLKKARAWIRQELDFIGCCDHDVGLCVCEAESMLAGIDAAITKGEKEG